MRRIIDRYENAIVKMQNSAKEFTVQGSLIEVNKEIQNSIRILERFTNPDDELINSLSSEAKAIVELCSNKELYHGSTIDISEIINLVDEDQLYQLIGEEYIIPKLNPIDELKFAILDSGGFLGFIQYSSQDDLIQHLSKIDEEFTKTEIVNNPEWDELYHLIKFSIQSIDMLTRISKFENNTLLENGKK
tara:strand:+ start:66729 stop:67298 length:570 start_codon:yes stop_codon:yes gene_type:complete